MDPDDQRLLHDTYRLTVENHRMLRSMRRQAFWGRIITWIVYAALLVAPVWFYMTYLSSTVDRVLQAYGVMQKNEQDAGAQYQNFKEAFQQFQARFQNPSSSSTDTTAPSQ